MRTRLITLATGLVLALAACSNDAPATEAAAAPAQTEAAAPAPAPAPANDTTGGVHVLAGTTEFGDVLVGPDGRTLYGFTNDVEAASTCYGTCADAWPPVIVPDDWTAGPGLDFGIFATTLRDDGTKQLVAGKWPLYYFAGDAVPGDVTGQGSGDVWFVVDLDGRLITESGGDTSTGGGETESTVVPVSIGVTDLGDTLVDAQGLTLYGFTNDENGVPSCYDACADAWPPLTVEGTDLPAGLDPAVFSVIGRDDGTNQIVAGTWPLYYFAGDAAPGDINGQESGGVWFAAAPDGGLIKPGSTDGY